MVALLACLSLVVGSAAAAAPPDRRTTVRGPDFTVRRVAGGFEVELELARELPVVASAPRLLVDGVEVGPAVESADGTSLTVLTTDEAVLDATEVAVAGVGEASASTDGAPAPEASTAPAGAEAAVLDDDPAALGDHVVTEGTYAFGDRAIPLLNIGGIRGELEGKVYLPDGDGPKPTVVFLHGRHSSCYGSGDRNPDRWPCAPAPDSDSERIPIPSYVGYDEPARALASNGYAVVSISANAINANDAQLSVDYGAFARGQLVLDSLAMLADVTAGEDVAYHDAWTDTTVTLAEALDGLTPADLVGQFDLDTVGIMGHSRGGEGVLAASTLNDALPVDEQFGIDAVLPLAPVDYDRIAVPNVPMMTVLPYCDGDVENLMGQHAVDDARHNFDDDALRSAMTVIGGNHNYFNTIWTPGLFPASTSDDWRFARSDDPVCDPDAATTTRLTPAEQRAVGTASMAGFFRLVLGGEDEFLPLFDGSDTIAPTVAGFADIRVTATAPNSSRVDIDTFELPDSSRRPLGDATVQVCESMSDVEVPQALPFCATTLDQAATPHWSPARAAPNIPSSPMLHLTWDQVGDGVAVPVPAAARDASGVERLTVKMAADENVATGTDLTITVADGSGSTWSRPVSALDDDALLRMPGTTSEWLRKVMLHQVVIPVADLDGLDVTDLREVWFSGAVGADGTASGGVHLSDLSLATPAVGARVPAQQATVDLVASRVAEGDGPGTAGVAVVLSEPLDHPVTTYVSAFGADDARAGVAMEPITFAPGQTCQVAMVPTHGDDVAGETASSSFTLSATNVSGAVMGIDGFATLTVVEDDGVVDGDLLPAVGEQGDACVEHAESSTTGEVAVGTRRPVEHGGEVTVVAEGYRTGEVVSFTLGGVEVGSALATADGVVTHVVIVPNVLPRGWTELEAVGAGSGRTAIGQVHVKVRGRPCMKGRPPVCTIGSG